MAFFDTFSSKLNTLDEHSWYKYAAISLAIFIGLMGAILFFYYRSLSYWDTKFEALNQERKEARTYITKAAEIEKQRSHMNALLQEDPNFKIKGFMQDIFVKLGIDFSSQNDTTTDRDDIFKETTATYQITGISMKQLAELLNEIEENPRVFTKELDITKSKKIPHTIDISISIAAMMPR